MTHNFKEPIGKYNNLEEQIIFENTPVTSMGITTDVVVRDAKYITYFVTWKPNTPPSTMEYEILYSPFIESSQVPSGMQEFFFTPTTSILSATNQVTTLQNTQTRNSFNVLTLVAEGLVGGPIPLHQTIARVRFTFKGLGQIGLVVRVV